VRYLLPAESVERFYLLFPDPWPKRRHHRRRIVTPDFLSSIHAALQRGGSIYIATDDVDYFEIIKEVAESDRRFAISEGDVDLPLSRFDSFSGKRARQSLAGTAKDFPCE